MSRLALGWMSRLALGWMSRLAKWIEGGLDSPFPWKEMEER
jgi:hypothetical protein